MASRAELWLNRQKRRKHCSCRVTNVNFKYSCKQCPLNASGAVILKKWVHKALNFHSSPRDDKIKRKWKTAISLKTKDHKWDASHCVCSAHFHGGHLYGSNNIPVIFPRRDLKTGKVAWPIDISHLLVEKTSEEDQRSSTVSVHVTKVIKWLPSHKNLRKHLLC